YGIIDLLASRPSLFLLPGFRVLRILRFLRIFRIFKATRFILAVDRLTEALNEIRRELLALVILSLMLVYLAACGIHYFEREKQPEEFGTILDSMWWAIVTLTTVGYGDVYPITPGGKIFTALVTLVGVGLIAIPSGLLASVLTEARVERKIEEESEENVKNASTEGSDATHANKHP
ncbi:MAG: ion transporter, partial [Gammaproteobacteria bacterium]|nr:ion transporter [Gammaproteobacteria bacterium]